MFFSVLCLEYLRDMDLRTTGPSQCLCKIIGRGEGGRVETARPACAQWDTFSGGTGVSRLSGEEGGTAHTGMSRGGEEQSPASPPLGTWPCGEGVSCHGAKGERKGEGTQVLWSPNRGASASPDHPWFCNVHGLPGACPFLELERSGTTSVLKSSAYENTFGDMVQSENALVCCASRTT